MSPCCTTLACDMDLTAAQATAADDLVEQCPSVVTEPVCLPDPTTMQQLIGESAVASSRGKEGTSGDALTLPELADRLIKLTIKTTVDLNEEEKKDVYDMLMSQASKFMESCNYSKVTGVRAFVQFLEKAYVVSLLTFVALNKGSLIISLNCNKGSLTISLNCKMLKGLDQLWKDYLSGHLNKVAELDLVTGRLKANLNLLKINSNKTMKNHWKCRKVILEPSVSNIVVMESIYK